MMDQWRRVRGLVCACAAVLAGVQTAAAQPCFGTIVIDPAVPQATSVVPVDIDGDGDIDLFVASYDADEFLWFENDGEPTPTFTKHVLPGVADGALDIAAGDLDGDGDIDAACTSSIAGKLAWHENDGAADPSFTERVIGGIDPLSSAFSVFVADVDGEDGLDLVTASRGSDEIAWLENDGGLDPTFTRHVVTAAADGANAVVAEDLDGDGDLDLLASHQNTDIIAWYESSGGSSPTFVERIITMGVDRPLAVAVGDLDGDGDVDALSASLDDSVVAWYENDGELDPSFTMRTLPATGVGPRSVATADVDGDGDLDVLVASRDTSSSGPTQVAWLENDGQPVPGFVERVIETDLEGASDFRAADLDGDGDADLVATSSSAFSTGSVLWHRQASVENVNSGARFIEFSQAMSAALGSDTLVGDPFVLGGGCLETMDLQNKSVTVESLGAFDRPAGTTTILSGGSTLRAGPGEGITIGGEVRAPVVLPSTLDAPEVTIAGQMVFGAFLSRLVATGDLRLRADIAFAIGAADRVLTDQLSFVSDVAVADVDLDGIPDVVASSERDDEIVWFRGLGGEPLAFQEIVIDPLADRALAIDVADLDSDGDPDVLAVLQDPRLVVWLENNHPTPTFTRRVIQTGENGLSNVIAVDLDSDGDLDAVTTSLSFENTTWHENDGDADPTFTNRVIDDTMFGAFEIDAADLDGDGDIDLAAAVTFFGQYVWYESSGGATPTFTRRVFSSGRSFPSGVAAGDLDNDGDTDLLVTTFEEDLVSWFENLGGSPPVFAERVITNAEFPLRPQLLDIDGDGDLDGLVGQQIQVRNDRVLWLENDGAASPTFTTRVVTSSLTESFSAIAAGDLDLDGVPDLTIGYGDLVEWIAGSQQPSVAIGPSSSSVEALGDVVLVNKRVSIEAGASLVAGGTLGIDGASELGGAGIARGPVIANAGAVRPDPARSLRLEGDLAGSFDDGTAGERAGSVVIDLGDAVTPSSIEVTGDATLDGSLIVTTEEALDPQTIGSPVLLTAADIGGSRFAVSLLPNIGDENFLSVVYTEATLRAGSDRALATVSLQVNALTGDVELDPQASADSNAAGVPRGATLGDLDLDGDPDLLIALPDPISPTTAPGSVVVLYNADDGDPANGWEGFGDTLQITAGIGVNPSAVAVGALDGDAQPDIAVANRGDPGDPTPDTVAILLVADPSALGFSTSATFLEVVGDQPSDLVIADLDGDSLNDLAVSNAASHSVTYAPNNGFSIGGAWERVDPDNLDLPDEDECPLSIRPGETSAGVVFLATANAGNDTAGLIQINPDGTATVRPSLPVDDEPIAIVVADLDGDGSDDLATVNRAGASISVALNSSAGAVVGFASSSSLPIDAASAAPRSLAAGDLDADGDTDLAALAGGVVKILRNDLAGAQLAFTPIADQPAGDDPLLLLSGDLNADGRDDVVSVSESAGGARSGGSRAPGDAVNTLLAAPTPACPADVDGDGDTDVFDFADLAASFGAGPGATREQGDLTGDGFVDVFDFAELAAGFGCGG